MIREPIYAALFALVKTAKANGFVTVKRQVPRQSFDTDRAKLPALYMIQKREEPQQLRRGLPPIWKFTVTLMLFAAGNGTEDATPMTVINPLLDAICEVIVPPNSPSDFVQTLGGLVSSCVVSGSSEIFEGLDASVSGVLLEVTIIVPS